MKPKIKDMWLEALRSGEYKQGYDTLCKNNKFCCLGVLTDLYQKDMKKKKKENAFHRHSIFWCCILYG